MASTHFEFHAPHWHGNVVTSNHARRRRSCPWGWLSPMVPDNPGTYYHRHVGSPGMGTQAIYTVTK
jgi:hypothetical protein